LRTRSRREPAGGMAGGAMSGNLLPRAGSVTGYAGLDVCVERMERKDLASSFPLVAHCKSRGIAAAFPQKQLCARPDRGPTRRLQFVRSNTDLGVLPHGLQWETQRAHDTE
jgi:hypothetical protein